MSKFLFRSAAFVLASFAAVAGLPAGPAHASHVRGAPNSPPVGVDDTFQVEEGTSLNVAAPGLLANDSDPDGDPIELNGVVQPANGLVQSSAAGSFAYTPDAGFTGVDTFFYGIEDDNGNSTGLVVEVTITVTPTPRDPGGPNRPPVGVDDAFEVVEGTTLVVAAPGLLANDSDPDGDPISVSSASTPANGSFSGQQVGSFRYTPDPGFTGVDSFRYAVEDDQGNNTGVVVNVVITVTPAPEPTTTTTATDPATTDPATTDPEGSGSPSDVDSSETAPAGPAEPTGEVVVVAGATSDPAVTTTTLPGGVLPVTGVEPIALGLGVFLVAAGLVVTALGTIATHGVRRAGRGHHVRHW